MEENTQSIAELAAENMMSLPKEKSEIIKIIGVGGAGCNAVNNMYRTGINGVNFIVANTDLQALEDSPVPRKIQLGRIKTAGLGAGNDPQMGRDSATEAVEDIRAVLSDNAHMVFVAAGMGGGTGTGAAPVIAQTAKDMGLLTVGLVSIPYRSEGLPRLRQAIEGTREMSKHVDSLIVINSERLYDMYGDLPLTQAFAKADNVHTIAAKGLSELITTHMRVNVDFADVRNAMTNSGCAVMGIGEANGEGRALNAVQEALNSPLLNNNDIKGATHIIASIISHPDNEITLKEQGVIGDYLLQQAGGESNKKYRCIWGFGVNESVEPGSVKVTVIATGFTTDCFEDNKSKVIDVSVNGELTASETGSANSATETEGDDEDEIDIIVSGIYGGPAKDTNSPRLKPLAAPKVVPFDQLDEQTLTYIESTPAYKRRSE